jgi:hypothetical protein
VEAAKKEIQDMHIDAKKKQEKFDSLQTQFEALT